MTPTLTIIAGPNGSGKSTLADLLLKEESLTRFINADILAKGLTGINKAAGVIEAGKIMLRQINDSINSLESIAFETTLSGLIWKKTIKRAKDKGYQVNIIFVTVSSAKLAFERVKKRVAEGGHFVPEEVVYRRYQRSREMFKFYRSMVNNWYVFDNSNSHSELIARKENGSPVVFLNNDKFLQLFGGH